MLFYIHIPFCRRRCLYCAFYSQPLGTSPVPDSFVKTLSREIALYAQHKELWAKKDASSCPASDSSRITSIFFGGGTPSLLQPADIAAILDAVAASFSIAEDCEISMEANPDSLAGKEQVKALASAGINRLSLGVQSMEDAELAMLGRVHNVSQVYAACSAIHTAGIPSLNLDLMWGLPGQSKEGWLSTLEKALQLSPDHLSCYALTLELGTPLAAKVSKGELVLPNEDETEAMYLEGAELLESAGIFQYEISNYAKKGHQCRHNLGYWHQDDYLGVGPSAVSTAAGTRLTAPADYALWEKAVQAGELPAAREDISGRAEVEEMIMLRLRTTEGLPYALYRQAAGRDFAGDFSDFLAVLKDADLVRMTNDSVCLTRRGLLVSNDILARLFDMLDKLPDQEALA